LGESPNLKWAYADPTSKYKGLFKIAKKAGEIIPKVIVREQQIDELCSDNPNSVMEKMSHDLRNGGGTIYDKVDSPRLSEPPSDTGGDTTRIA
jgi:hypothetical protein